MSSNPHDCCVLPTLPGCPNVLEDLYWLEVVDYIHGACSWLLGEIFTVTWQGSNWRGQKTIVHEGTPYTFDLVLYQDPETQQWFLKNQGCNQHVEPGGIGCDPFSIEFESMSGDGCGCGGGGADYIPVVTLPY